MREKGKLVLSGIFRMTALVIIFCGALLAGHHRTDAYTAHTVEEAINWCYSQVGKSIDTDGYPSGQPYQCVDLVKAYYQYLGVSAVSGNGGDYAWNSLPSGWSRVQGGTPQRGDILVYGASSDNQYGHVGIYEADYSHFHQNVSGAYVSRITGWRYNGFNNPYWGYIRPDWNIVPPSATWTNETNSITDTNAMLKATTTMPSTGNFSLAEVTLWNASGTQLAHKAENVSYNSSYMQQWYDIQSELGVTLTPSTKYKYQFTAVYNGTTYKSDVWELTTSGPVEPTWTNETNSITGTNAELRATTTMPSTGNFSLAEVTLWNAGGTQLAHKAENVSYNSSYMTQWYDVQSELGVTLSPGATYKYQFTAVYNGISYKSEVWELTTIPPAPTPTPIPTPTPTPTPTPEPTHTHVPVRESDKAATCTEDGYIGATICSECGETISEREVVKAKGHDWGNWTTVKEATDSEDGMEIRVCRNDSDHMETRTIQKSIHTHTPIKEDDKAPTCLESGYTGATVCAVCGATIKERQSVPATGHNWGEWTVLNEATDTTPGLKIRVCKNNTEHIEQEEIPAATPLDDRTDIAQCNVRYYLAKAVYTGRPLKPIFVLLGDTILTEGTDYLVTYSDNIAVGTGRAKIEGIGTYRGEKSVSFPITAATNSISVTPLSKTVKYAKLKNGKQTVTIKATAAGESAKTSFKLTSVPKKAKKYISMSAAGKITIKKGLAKGSYNLKIRVTSAATANYASSYVDKTIRLIVK